MYFPSCIQQVVLHMAPRVIQFTYTCASICLYPSSIIRRARVSVCSLLLSVPLFFFFFFYVCVCLRSALTFVYPGATVRLNATATLENNISVFRLGGQPDEYAMKKRPRNAEANVSAEP